MDRYTIPGSDGVLKNRLDLTTHEQLDEALNDFASVGWAQLVVEPIPDRLDLAYLQSIHKRFFSPVLEWAGQLRLPGDEVVAGGTGIVYAMSEFFRSGLDDVFGRLAQADYLRGLPRETFAVELADKWGYLTQVHPFRDGNTRSQAAYFDRLAVRAGHQIDWTSIDVDLLRKHRLAAITAPQHLAAYLAPRLVDPYGDADDPSVLAVVPRQPGR
ncbi:MAG: Fic family protein [Micrococcales bacterium]|nr:Fic family protein [Micrococcales bacterium]MCL2668220.1 Fic family protein [Micrococcales bacterium]